MTKPRRSLKRRLLRLFLWLGGIALAFFTYVALLGDQTDFYLMARYTVYQMSDANVVPQPLMDDSISETAGTTLSCNGTTFEVPWKGVTEQKSPHNIALVKFASGQVLTIFAPTGKSGFLQQVADDTTTMGSPQMRALFAADIKDGPYQEEVVLLNATSDQVKFLDPAWVSERRFFLLFFKSVAENPEIKTGIYAFYTPVVRGFQIGNPAYSPRVRLDFFDPNGDSLGEVVSLYGKETSYRGTQAELNRIIQTFHPLATTAPVSPSATNQPRTKGPLARE